MRGSLRASYPLTACCALAAALWACSDRVAGGSADADGGGTGADAADDARTADAAADAGGDGSADAGTGDAAEDAAPDASGDGGTDAGQDAAADAAPDAGDAGDAGDGGGGPVGPLIRFAALGDTGKGNDTQAAVALAMKTVCDARGGCGFALLLGDNIYDDGPNSADDPQFQTKFEQPYAPLAFPFHVVLGNHDYGGNGAGYEFDKAQYEIDYTQRSQKWRLPAAHYAFTEPPVDFIALDTNSILFGFDDEQRQAMPERLAAAHEPWKLAFGHHPFISNGRHGNAGGYDGLPSWIPIASGKNVKKFAEDELCGQVDVYLCGHDHNLQDLGATCGTEFLISGGGAATTALEGSNPVHFQSDAPGFLVVEATPQTMTFTFFDQNAGQLHTRTIAKP